jgi:hypothetical protein
VQGNLIGTNATGTQPIPNEVGIFAGGLVNDATIGGTAPGMGNIIAFNDGPAVEVVGTGVQIEGNSIYGNGDTNGGTGPAIDNLSQDHDSLATLVDANWPGGPFTGTDNSSISPLTLTQSGSTLTYSGTLNGLPSTPYLVTLNAISDDGTYWGSYYTFVTTSASGQVTFARTETAPAGFVYTGAVPAAAQSYVAHSLGNHDQNYPVLTAASSTGTSVTISGTLNSAAGHTYRLEFFSNASPGQANPADPTDTNLYGEGQTFLGSAQVTTDPTTGNASFTATLSTPVLAGQDYLTATATDVTVGQVGYGDTSEFSPDFTIPAVNQAPLTSPNLQALLGALSASGELRTVFFEAPSQAVADAFMAIFSSTNPSPLTVPPGAATPISIEMNFGSGISVNEANLVVPAGFKVSINGGAWHGGSPALTLASGSLTVSNATFVNTTDAPTILVTGGSLTLRNDVVQGPAAYTDPAIAVTGGTLDLGTAASPGGNTLSVSSLGDLVSNTTGNAIPAVGDTFVVGGTVKTAPSLSFSRLATSAASTIPGQTATFTATVAPDPPASATPTGSINFYDTTTGTDLGTVTLSGGVASLGTSALGLGTHVIRASYAGDANYLPSVALVTQTVTQSIYVLNGTAGGALSLSGNASINLPGAVVVDSNSRSALTESGNASIKAASIQVVGGVTTSGNATLSPAATTGVAAVADPLAGLTGPGTAGLTNYGAASFSKGAHTLSPGIYTQISASGNASLTLSPGLYLIEGGGFTVTGNASVTGAGVTVYNTSSNYPSNTGSYGGITLSGNGSFSLSAPTAGQYAGIVIFQARANTRAMSLSGNAAAGLSGTVYAPAALLYVSGNASLQGALDVNELALSGNAAGAQAADGSDVSSGSTPGQLLAGNVEVYVDNSNGDLTAAELARVQDAVTAVDAVTAPYGVTVQETTDPTQATVTLGMASTSPVGGYGAGILGCFDPSAAQVTMVQGWDWYAGSDPTQVGAGQYDFETTVTHELGHALGLGESADPTSAMYGTLAAGTTIRTLTTADLNTPYDEAGADAQRAAGAPPDAGAVSPTHAVAPIPAEPALPARAATPAPAGTVPMAGSSPPAELVATTVSAPQAVFACAPGAPPAAAASSQVPAVTIPLIPGVAGAGLAKPGPSAWALASEGQDGDMSPVPVALPAPDGEASVSGGDGCAGDPPSRAATTDADTRSFPADEAGSNEGGAPLVGPDANLPEGATDAEVPLAALAAVFEEL